MQQGPYYAMPTDDEIGACSVHRNAPLDLWKPPLVVLLGATAARVFLGPGTKISDLRGRRIEQDGRAYYPTFHPSYLLHGPSMKALAWQDWQHVRDDFRGLATTVDTGPQEADDTAVLMPYLEQRRTGPDVWCRFFCGSRPWCWTGRRRR